MENCVFRKINQKIHFVRTTIFFVRVGLLILTIEFFLNFSILFLRMPYLNIFKNLFYII